MAKTTKEKDYKVTMRDNGTITVSTVKADGRTYSYVGKKGFGQTKQGFIKEACNALGVQY